MAQQKTPTLQLSNSPSINTRVRDLIAQNHNNQKDRDTKQKPNRNWFPKGMCFKT